MKKHWLAAVALATLVAAPARADVWDVGDDIDDSLETDNRLVHGSVQVHDLAARSGVVDQDWYLVAVPPYSSFEVAIDGWAGDVGPGSITLDRLDTFGTLVQQGSWVDGQDSHASRARGQASGA